MPVSSVSSAPVSSGSHSLERIVSSQNLIRTANCDTWRLPCTSSTPRRCVASSLIKPSISSAVTPLLGLDGVHAPNAHVMDVQKTSQWTHLNNHLTNRVENGHVKAIKWLDKRRAQTSVNLWTADTIWSWSEQIKTSQYCISVYYKPTHCTTNCQSCCKMTNLWFQSFVDFRIGQILRKNI